MPRRNSTLKLHYWEIPDAARDGWRAVASALTVGRKVREGRASEYASLKRNEEYRPEVKEAKLASALADYQERAAAVFSGAREAVESAIAGVRSEISERLVANPLPDLPDPGKRDGAGQVEVANRLATIGRLLARQEVDRLLDRALEAERRGDGLALLRTVEACSHDSLLAWTMENYGRARIDREGSDAQRQAVAAALDAAREARIEQDEDLRLLADHRDELTDALQMLEIAAESAKSETFLLGGSEPGFDEVERAYGQLLAVE